jgi:hypothetical protein
MKNYFQSFAALLLCVLLPAAATPQALPDNPQPAARESPGWAHVQNLAEGEQITVALPGGEPVHCVFTDATDDELFCNALYRGREYRFTRAEIDRLRRDDRYRNTRIVIGAFTVTGLIWGAASPPSDGTSRALAGLAGAGVGALAGLLVSIPIALAIPGRTVFHQPASKHHSHSFDPTRRVPSAVPDQSDTAN